MSRASLRPIQAALICAVAFGTCSCSAARGDESESERIPRLLALRRGSVVADVGAGDGDWTAVLARAVGSEGRVYATEVDDQSLDALADLVDREQLANVFVLRGDDADSGLPEGCCESILLRLVYHHFTDPAPMRGSLARALRPGGRLVVIDIRPQHHWPELEGVPDRGGHGIEPHQLIGEMAANGFLAIEEVAAWNGDDDRYCIVFTLAEARSEGRPPRDRSSGP